MKLRKRFLPLALMFCVMLSVMALTAQAATMPMEAIGIPIEEEDVPFVGTLNGAPFTLRTPKVADIYYGRSVLAEMPNREALLYAYDAIAAGVENCAEQIPVNNGSTLTKDELKVVMEAYTGDHAEHFWLGGAYSYTYDYAGNIYDLIPGYFVGENFVAGYLLSGAQLTATQAAFEQEIDDILSGLHSSWSDFEKELYLHDVLADRITYTFAANAHNAYGALVEGEAVCEGYAEAFQVLLHRAGIRSYIATGWSRGEGHAWNLVEIDGTYYYVDLTWNDQGEELYHAYFNITEDVLTQDHVIGGSIGLPDCTAEDANYFAVMGGAITAFDGAEIGALLKDNGLTVHVYASGPMTANGLINAYVNNIRQVASAAGVNGGFMYGYSNLGREVVLRITPYGLSGAVRRAGEGSIKLTVRGLFDTAVTADLYAAVYDPDGRMIGIEKAVGQTLTTGGTGYTVDFSGDADIVRAFAVNGAGVPVDTAVELNIR